MFITPDGTEQSTTILQEKYGAFIILQVISKKSAGQLWVFQLPLISKIQFREMEHTGE
jgi:hypothetical protein